MLVSGNDFGKQVADALGLKNANHITIDMDVHKIVNIKVSYFTDGQELNKLIPILKEYQLVERVKERHG